MVCLVCKYIGNAFIYFFTTVVNDLTSLYIKKEVNKESVAFNSCLNCSTNTPTLNTVKKSVVRITISFYFSTELDLLSTKTELYKDPTPFVKKNGEMTINI